MVYNRYSRCWVHVVWHTRGNHPVFPMEAARELSIFLNDFAGERNLHLSSSFVGCDHVHVLADLPVELSLQELASLLKEGSSGWINRDNRRSPPFAWGEGFGAFSVSHADHNYVARWIAEQRFYHRIVPFFVEYREMVEEHGLCWYSDS